MRAARHRSEPSPARRAQTFARVCLALAVAVAVFTPARGTGATTSTADRSHHIVGTRPAESRHGLAAVRTARVGNDAHLRTGTPLGTVPAAVALAGLAVALVAIARRTHLTVRRPRPAFFRRGPPSLRTAS